MPVKPYQITHDGSIVTIRKTVDANEDFDEILHKADRLRGYFKRGVGSDWGCDGVGYMIQKRIRVVELHRSGVRPINFKRGLTEIASKASTGW